MKRAAVLFGIGLIAFLGGWWGWRSVARRHRQTSRDRLRRRTNSRGGADSVATVEVLPARADRDRNEGQGVALNCRHCARPMGRRLNAGTRRFCDTTCRRAYHESRRDISAEQIEERFREAKAQLAWMRRAGNNAAR
jgi:hypothetical protein